MVNNVTVQVSLQNKNDDGIPPFEKGGLGGILGSANSKNSTQSLFCKGGGNPLHTYQILGLLLSYPEKDFIECIGELEAILTEELLVPKKYQKQLYVFLNRIKSTELLELQEQYVELFDRTPSLSLHLFEHVYGESRDRGQAMVSLASRYHEKGLSIKQGELPDYLPLFLEFLSVLDRGEANALLGEPLNIITVLGKRLKERHSDYSIIFDMLEHLSAQKPNKEIVENKMTASDGK